MFNKNNVENGFSWIIFIDGEECPVETRVAKKNIAIREAIIARTGRTDWSPSSFGKFRSEHQIKILRGPILLNRKAICSDNIDF